MRGRVWGYTAAIAAVVVMALPSGAAAFDAKLKRYPYLTDLVGTSVMVNWATDITATSAVVKYGLNGGTCDTNTVTATRTFILVNGVSEYQWKAQLTGLAPDTQYCYRVYFGSAQLDLLGTDASPVFRTQIPAGSSAPFKFAVLGNWGKTLAAGNPHQANVISQIAQSGSRFAVTTGDNAYEVGSQKSYGDLYQVGDNTSAVFGPNYWKVAGASLPIFPAIGNHDHNNDVLLTNFPQDTAVATSGGQYTTQTYCCTNGTNQANYPNGWYAFDAGLARFYVLETAWEDTERRHRQPLQERLRQPLGAQLAAVPVAQERPRDPSQGGAVRVPPLPAVLGPVGDQLRHLPPGRQLARGAAEAPRRDRRLQRSLPQLPAQQRSRRRRPDLRERRWRCEPRVDRQPQRRLQRDEPVRPRLEQRQQHRLARAAPRPFPPQRTRCTTSCS